MLPFGMKKKTIPNDSSVPAHPHAVCFVRRAPAGAASRRVPGAAFLSGRRYRGALRIPDAAAGLLGERAVVDVAGVQSRQMPGQPFLELREVTARW